MLLVVDVGNTQTHLGLFSDGGLVASWRFATEGEKTGDELAVLLDALLRLDGFSRDSVTGLAVASVVPRLSDEYAAWRPRSSVSRRWWSGPASRPACPSSPVIRAQWVPTSSWMPSPAQELYGAPCIAVGFGTATTYSAVSAAGEYLGHAIAPGIEVSLDALATRAARLMKIELADPGTVIGKNTVAGHAGWGRLRLRRSGGRHCHAHAGRTGRPGGDRGHGWPRAAHLRARLHSSTSSTPCSPCAAWRSSTGATTPRRQCPARDQAAGDDPPDSSPLAVPFAIGAVAIPNRVVLAPMAGLTTGAYRRHLKAHGAGLVMTEMVSAYGLIYKNVRTGELSGLRRRGAAAGRSALRRQPRR